ncbi:MAG: group III truncated hemoglobin [Chitinophagaceae bacterium]|nr:MAG: globin family protein [Bacteroidetes bacterium OLB11]MCC6448532.1 group III truncated hemoglobin [Chitinophagaceae bacterium]HMN32865.1 group III truncated hemoglobin [Chitinophagaceae bacterium]
MNERKEIETLEDVKLLVNHFYAKVREDDMLKDIFNNVIQDRWPQHLEKMYRFWQTVLLEEHTYYGAPFVPHANLPVDSAHFERWVLLFGQTVDLYFVGENARKAKWQGEKMAELFLSKINYYRGSSSIPIY